MYFKIFSNIFNSHSKNKFEEKCLFITISFYRNIFLSQYLFIATLLVKNRSSDDGLNLIRNVGRLHYVIPIHEKEPSSENLFFAMKYFFTFPGGNLINKVLS